MELKYVGAMPQVSAKGVGFDETKQDKYTFLNAAVELIEALSFGATENTQHLYNVRGKEYNGKEIMDILKKHCTDINAVFSSRDEKSKELIGELILRVHNNTTINEDERQAWLNNIALMSDYYMQHVINESAYNCALNILSDEIHDARIQKITVPMFRNYGIVFHDLLYILEHRKSPIDAKLSIEHPEDGYVGILSITHR